MLMAVKKRRQNYFIFSLELIMLCLDKMKLSEDLIFKFIFAFNKF